MTVENTKARWRYTGDGATTSFAYDNKVTAAGDLMVYLDGVLQGSGYNVTNVLVKTGGNVVFDAPPAASVRIDVVRLVTGTQGADFSASDSLPSEKVEAAADRAMLVLQDLRALADLTLRLAVNAEHTGVSLDLPSLVASRVLGVNSGGNGFEWVEAAGAAPVTSVFGRLGVVTAQTGDYDAQQIDNTSAVTGGSVSAALNTLNSGQQAVSILARLLTVDGPGSGLDADTLDGDQAVVFERVAAKGTMNGYAGLDSGGKVPTSQLPASVVGAVAYQGTWNASTNSPALATGVGTQGHYYRVSVAGTTNLDGISSWAVGDHVIFDGTAWDKIDNTDQVTSVHGRQGAVTGQNGDYTASQITNTPAGGIAAVTVQAALDELDTEKQATLSVVSQAEAEAGVATTERIFTAQRVAQAIAALRDDQALIIAVGDETTAITTGTAKITFRMPYAFTLSDVKASLTTAGTTLSTIDINEGGATILSTKLTIDANETTSETAAAAAVMSDASLAADAEITIDIDGAGTSAAGLKITLIGKRG